MKARALHIVLLLASAADDGWLAYRFAPTVRVAERPRRVLFFTASWCPHCGPTKTAMTNWLATSPEPWQVDDTAGAHVQIVDSDRRPDLVRQYRVAGLPTVMLVDGGREVTRGNFRDVITRYAKGP